MSKLSLWSITKSCFNGYIFRPSKVHNPLTIRRNPKRLNLQSHNTTSLNTTTKSFLVNKQKPTQAKWSRTINNWTTTNANNSDTESEFSWKPIKFMLSNRLDSLKSRSRNIYTPISNTNISIITPSFNHFKPRQQFKPSISSYVNFDTARSNSSFINITQDKAKRWYLRKCLNDEYMNKINEKQVNIDLVSARMSSLKKSGNMLEMYKNANDCFTAHIWNIVAKEQTKTEQILKRRVEIEADVYQLNKKIAKIMKCISECQEYKEFLLKVRYYAPSLNDIPEDVLRKYGLIADAGLVDIQGGALVKDKDKSTPAVNQLKPEKKRRTRRQVVEESHDIVKEVKKVIKVSSRNVRDKKMNIENDKILVYERDTSSLNCMKKTTTVNDTRDTTANVDRNINLPIFATPEEFMDYITYYEHKLFLFYTRINNTQNTTKDWEWKKKELKKNRIYSIIDYGWIIKTSLNIDKRALWEKQERLKAKLEEEKQQWHNKQNDTKIIAKKIAQIISNWPSEISSLLNRPSYRMTRTNKEDGEMNNNTRLELSLIEECINKYIEQVNNLKSKCSADALRKIKTENSKRKKDIKKKMFLIKQQNDRSRLIQRMENAKQHKYIINKKLLTVFPKTTPKEPNVENNKNERDDNLDVLDESDWSD